MISKVNLSLLFYDGFVCRNLSYNKLSGDIPDSLAKLPKLTYLWGAIQFVIDIPGFLLLELTSQRYYYQYCFSFAMCFIEGTYDTIIWAERFLCYCSRRQRMGSSYSGACGWSFAFHKINYLHFINPFKELWTKYLLNLPMGSIYDCNKNTR